MSFFIRPLVPASSPMPDAPPCHPPRSAAARSRRALLQPALLLVAGLFGGPPALQAQGASAPAAAASAPVPEVRTARAKPVAAGAPLRLPARTEPIEEARLYARSSGTLVERRVDLGDRVAAGALLARIAAPEVDQALASARAGLGQAQARERLAQLNLDRSRPLVEQNFLSAVRLDELNAALEVARADTAAAQAEVRRLEAVQGFQQVRAPFAGTIVERAVERGDRVSADGANSSPALFRLARLDALRVVVEVPQAAAATLQPGRPAELRFAEFPGEVFKARVERLAGRIDPASGAMRVELKLPNPGQRLPAGLRGELDLAADAAEPGVTVPGNAVLLRGGQPHVATVDGDSRLRFVPVQVERTAGREVLLRRGLAPGQTVVINVNALLQDGSRVKVAAP